jgi:hypothetical protein
MANDDLITARGGLLPVNYPMGNYRRNYYRLTTSAAAVFIGQPMDLDTNGQAAVASTSTANSLILGPVVGFARDSRGKSALPDDMLVLTPGSGGYLIGNRNAYVCIADDPNQEFIIQEASTATQLTTANIGAQAHFSYLRAASGSTVTGYSAAELNPNVSGATNGSSGALQVIGLADQMNSDGSYNDLGAYAKWRVRISNHRLGGVGLASTSV